ncbi:FAD synthase [Natrinema salinisoli]|uniref:FAD synthase n=1 Tax=Natrinema salinisoli TaxID=2878535 RepID=UPI001CF04B85
MARIMAQGTFDILHPGHLHYLQESRKLGEELYVVISRDSRVSEKKNLFMDEEARRQIVDALKVVDEAVLGSEGSIFETVNQIDPDVITLGHDQTFDVDELETTLAEHGHPDIRVVRISAFEPEEDNQIVSSSEIKERLRRTQSG